MTDESDLNPYAPPEAAAEPATRRTRWRIVPVTLLLIFGGIGVVASPIPLIVAYNRPVEFGGGITWGRIVGVGLTLGGSVLWIATAVLCWRWKWRRMILTFVVALAACLAAQYLLADLEL